jgi:hypothetical protein
MFTLDIVLVEDFERVLNFIPPKQTMTLAILSKVGIAIATSGDRYEWHRRQ